MPITLQSSLGKYRDLVFAITLFLILDIGVLVFNVIASREIERDAAEINTAGELRMVSQQLAKSLLTLEDEVRDGKPTQTSLAQISEASDEFDQSLAQLQQSRQGPYAVVLGDSAGWEERRRLLGELATEWGPLGRDVNALLQHKETLTIADVAPVSNKSVSRNLKLLEQSDDLTQQMEDIARAKTTQIRVIQLAAISLALLNFLFIVLKFIRQLNASDRRAAAARDETRQILETVHQGLFLLHSDGTIGDQRSASMARLFGRPVELHANFVKDVLKPILKDDEQLETAQGYIGMLFDKKVKPALLEKLNPLVEIEVVTAADARRRQRFLTFAFEQVKRDGEVDALLVSVFDVSQEVLLERELAGTKIRASSEIELLLGVVDQDPVLVGSFMDGARKRIDLINRELQAVKPEAAAYAQVINLVARNVHWIKGEAALLNVGAVESDVHRFEDTLANLRGRNTLAGDDLIPVAVGVNDLLDRINRVDAIVRRVARFGQTTSKQESSNVTNSLAPIALALERLSDKVAQEMNKKVNLQVDVPAVQSVPERLLQVCQEVLPQLIRNAIVHGIEHHEERSRNGKEPAGSVSVRVDLEGASGFRVRVRDDGAGLSLPTMRQRAVEIGSHTATEAQQLADHEVVQLMFEPGFTTSQTAHLHAGRGDGLAVVREVLASIGARLRILSRHQAYTEFVVYMPA